MSPTTVGVAKIQPWVSNRHRIVGSCADGFKLSRAAGEVVRESAAKADTPASSAPTRIPHLVERRVMRPREGMREP